MTLATALPLLPVEALERGAFSSDSPLLWLSSWPLPTAAPSRGEWPQRLRQNKL